MGIEEGTETEEEEEESLTERSSLGFRSDRAAKTNRALSAADSSPWLLPDSMSMSTSITDYRSNDRSARQNPDDRRSSLFAPRSR